MELIYANNSLIPINILTCFLYYKYLIISKIQNNFRFLQKITIKIRLLEINNISLPLLRETKIKHTDINQMLKVKSLNIFSLKVFGYSKN